MEMEELQALEENSECNETSAMIDMATSQPDAKGKKFASFVRDYHVCKAFIELAFRTGKMDLMKHVKVILVDGTTLKVLKEESDND